MRECRDLSDEIRVAGKLVTEYRAVLDEKPQQHFLRFIFAVPTATAAVFVFGAVEAGGMALFPLYATRAGFTEAQAGFLLSCIVAAPVIAWFIKRHTGVLYPCYVDRYGGKEPYRTLLESIPRVPGRRRGRGFPAAHCSGAFALMSLYFVMPGPLRWLGLVLGLAAGWIVGLYQMFKGVHYLSHTIVTMFLVWTIVLALSRAFGFGLVA